MYINSFSRRRTFHDRRQYPSVRRYGLRTCEDHWSMSRKARKIEVNSLIPAANTRSRDFKRQSFSSQFTFTPRIRRTLDYNIIRMLKLGLLHVLNSDLKRPFVDDSAHRHRLSCKNDNRDRYEKVGDKNQMMHSR